MQVQIGGGDRRVAHPHVNRCRVDAAGQPQPGGRVPEVMDLPAVGTRRLAERAFECGGVQLVSVSVTHSKASCSRPSRSSRTIGSTRSATGTRRVLAGLDSFGRHSIRLSSLNDQHRHRQLDDVAHPELRPAQTGPRGREHKAGQPVVLFRSPLQSRSRSSSLKGYISVRRAGDRGTRVTVTG